MDSIGHRGLQLFVDMGYPVDNTLVNALVREVLQDKVRTMLGERPDQVDQPQPGTSRQQGEPQWEEPVEEEIREEVIDSLLFTLCATIASTLCSILRIKMRKHLEKNNFVSFCI